MDNNTSNTVEAATIQSPEAMPITPMDTQSGWMSMIPIVLIFFVMYFLLIRPQEKKRKEHEQMVKQAKKGDAVITVGGIYGTVIKVDDKEGSAVLEIAKDVHIKISKSAIADFLDKKADLPTKK
ncbi:MAG: preprotein translocase subunit YajC [Rickettsiaceae bacterium]|jgi:preprotein translocase subunit YajC|nr:preprotein translocase subunit YajC [Rickettsiaceae bacterium]